LKLISNNKTYYGLISRCFENPHCKYRHWFRRWKKCKRSFKSAWCCLNWWIS